MTAVHPPELCPVPDGECDEHLPADDGLRNVLAEMIAEGSDRSALLLGVLMSAAEYVRAQVPTPQEMAAKYIEVRDQILAAPVGSPRTASAPEVSP